MKCSYLLLPLSAFAIAGPVASSKERERDSGQSLARPGHLPIPAPSVYPTRSTDFYSQLKHIVPHANHGSVTSAVGPAGPATTPTVDALSTISEMPSLPSESATGVISNDASGATPMAPANTTSPGRDLFEQIAIMYRQLEHIRSIFNRTSSPTFNSNSSTTNATKHAMNNVIEEIAAYHELESLTDILSELPSNMTASTNATDPIQFIQTVMAEGLREIRQAFPWLASELPPTENLVVVTDSIERTDLTLQAVKALFLGKILEDIHYFDRTSGNIANSTASITDPMKLTPNDTQKVEFLIHDFYDNLILPLLNSTSGVNTTSPNELPDSLTPAAELAAMTARFSKLSGEIAKMVEQQIGNLTQTSTSTAMQTSTVPIPADPRLSKIASLIKGNVGLGYEPVSAVTTTTPVPVALGAVASMLVSDVARDHTSMAL